MKDNWIELENLYYGLPNTEEKYVALLYKMAQSFINGSNFPAQDKEDAVQDMVLAMLICLIFQIGYM